METTASGIDPLFPPGFRFYPTEEELLSFYLGHRLAGTRPDVEHFIPVVDIYGHHPRDLQCNNSIDQCISCMHTVLNLYLNCALTMMDDAAMSGAANVSDREQWFFFCPRAERETHGGRPTRTTPSGYWKATGSPSWVFSASGNRVIGEKRTMVFYQGRAPTGTKTRWKMNEYKAVVADLAVAVAPPVPLRVISLLLHGTRD
jgi:hypothetical protein